MGETYSCDINCEDLCNEIDNCRMLLIDRKNINVSHAQELLTYIAYGDDVFPNLRIILQILLTVNRQL